MIVAVALVPALALQAYTEFDVRQIRQQLMEDEALRLLQLVSSQQHRIVDAAEQVLNVIAATPAVKDNDPEACRGLLAELLKASPRYSNASVIGLNGRIVCSPLPGDPSINVSDRPYFRSALKTGHFVVGEYVVGRGSGLPTI